MTVVDFATLGIVGCLLILVALVDAWGTPMLERAAHPIYPNDDADE